MSMQVLYKGELLALRLIVVSGDGPSLLQVSREWLSEMEIDWKTLCIQSHVGIHRVPCGGPEFSLENLLEKYSFKMNMVSSLVLSYFESATRGTAKVSQNKVSPICP